MAVHLMTVPQLGVNDDVALLVAWLVTEGDEGSRGDPICELETSKAVVEITSDYSGYIAFLGEADTELAISAPLALIGESADAVLEEKTRRAPRITSAQVKAGRPCADNSNAEATDKAQRLAVRLGVDLSEVRPGPIGVIRESDVQRHHEVRQTKACADKATGLEPQPFEVQPGRVATLILGTGNGAKTMREALELGGTHQVVAFIGLNDGGMVEKEGLPVYRRQDLARLRELGIEAAGVAITKGVERLADVRGLEKVGIEPLNVIHPEAFIAPSVRIGKGCYVKARAVLETACVIGDAVLIDNGAILAHDNRVADGVHLAPGAVLGSSIEIGPMTIVGIGVSIATGTRIGGHCILSVGSSVTQDIPDHSVVEGVPGVVIGQRK